MMAELLNNALTKFKQYPLWQQTAVSSAIIASSTMFLAFGSYYYSKLKHNSEPTIYYTIDGDIHNNAGILVFIHGWPDFEYLWDPQTEYFQSKNYCCITLELPNLNIDRIQNPWGYDLMTVVNAMGNEIQNILTSNNIDDNTGIELITHDWGSYLGELLYIYYKNKIKINKLILLDVGDGSNRDKKEQYKYTYQLINALAFCFPRFLGTWYLRRYYNNLLNKRGINLPIMNLETKHKRKYFDSVQCYLYFYVLTTIFFGSRKRKQNITVATRLNEFDDVPVLFIDAKKGWHYPVRYYSDKFREYIEQRNNCKFIEFDCYHWMQDATIGLPQKLNTTIHEFLM